MRVIFGEVIDVRDVAFAAQNYVALVAALFVALSLDLQRPLWSMLTVFLVANPVAGELRSKAFYRILGTIIGASFSVVVTPLLSNSPELMCLALACWIAVCLYISLLDRTPRGYAAMLAGFTAAIVMFSDVSAPGEIFQTAVARVEEIGIGIICSCVAHSFLLPRTAVKAVRARVAKIMLGLDLWIADGLLSREGQATADRRRLASDITALQLGATHLAFDTGFLPPDRSLLAALQHRLALLPPLLSGVEDRMVQLRRDLEQGRDLNALAQEAGHWLESSKRREAGGAILVQRCKSLEQASLSGSPDWRALLVANASARLADLLSTVSDCHDLATAIRLAQAPSAPHLRAAARESIHRRLHRDHLVAIFSGVTAGLAVLCTCALWITTAWPQGGVAATFAAIGCCLFAIFDDPRASLLKLTTSIGFGIVVAAIYTFFIFPRIDGFVMLAAAIAPVALIISYFQAQPKWSLLGLGSAIGFVGAIDIQQRYVGNLASFLNGNVAEVMGFVFAYIIIRLVRVLDAEWVALRLMRHAWRSIANLAQSREPVERDQWLSAAVDRLGLVIPRLSEANQASESATFVHDIQVGLNVMEINAVRTTVLAAQQKSLTSVLEQVARVFTQRKPRRASGPNADALGAIDQALNVFIFAEDTDARRRALIALTGLRRSLFPQRPDFTQVAA